MLVSACHGCKHWFACDAATISHTKNVGLFTVSHVARARLILLYWLNSMIHSGGFQHLNSFCFLPGIQKKCEDAYPHPPARATMADRSTRKMVYIQYSLLMSHTWFTSSSVNTLKRPGVFKCREQSFLLESQIWNKSKNIYQGLTIHKVNDPGRKFTDCSKPYTSPYWGFSVLAITQEFGYRYIVCVGWDRRINVFTVSKH